MEHHVLRRIVPQGVPAVTLLILFSIASFGHALEMYALSMPRVTAAPSELITYVLQIENPVPEPIDVTFAIAMSEGWAHMGLPATLELAPLAGETLFVTILLPSHFAGTENVTVTAYTGGRPAASSTLEVEDVPISKVQLALVGPTDVLAGQDIVYSVRLVSTGNRADTYRLSASALWEWPVVVEPAILRLEPGESGTAQLRVAVPTTTLGTGHLTAHVLAEAEGDIVATERAALRIRGELANAEPLVAVLPAHLDLWYASDRGRSGLSLSGGGRIAIGPVRMVNFQVEGVDGAIQHGEFGLEGTTWAFTGGKVTPRWTGPLRLSGSGVEVRYHNGNSTWNAAGVLSQGGAVQLAYRLGKYELTAGSGWGPIVGTDGGAQSDNWGLTYRGDSGLHLGGKITRLTVEGDHRYDVSLSASGYVGDRFLVGNVQHTDAEFAGRSGRTALSATVYRPVRDRASLQARLSLAEELGQVGLERTWRQQLGLTERLPSGTSISVQQRSEWKWHLDTLDQATIWLEGTVRKGTTRAGRPLSATVSLARDFAYSHNAPSWMGSTKVAQIIPIGSGTLKLSTAGRIALWPDGAATYRLGASARATFRQVDGSRWGMQGALEYGGSSRVLEPRVTVTYERELIPSLHFMGQAGWKYDDGQAQTHFAARIRYHFDLPTPIPVRGRVEGVLVSADVEAVAGRIVSVGDYFTVTDAEGRFVFMSLPAGTYRFRVVNLPAQVHADPSMTEVTVEAGRTTQLRVGLTTVGSIEGHIGIDTSSLLWGAVPSVDGLRVQLYRENTFIAETRTRADGTFSFWDVAPGNYTVMLDTGDLPSNVTAQKVSESVHVGKGARAAVEFWLAAAPPVIDFLPLPPSAGFSYEPLEPVATEPVTFTSQSVIDWTRSMRSLTWDMGDGHAYNGPRATHVYTEPGVYTVRLTVVDSFGESDVAEQEITVLP